MSAYTETALRNVRTTVFKRATHSLEFKLEHNVSVEDLFQTGHICYPNPNVVTGVMVTETKCVVAAGP